MDPIEEAYKTGRKDAFDASIDVIQRVRDELLRNPPKDTSHMILNHTGGVLFVAQEAIRKVRDV